MNIIFCLLIVGTTTAQVLINPPSRDCRELGDMAVERQVDGPLPQYVAGKVMTVKAQLPEVEAGIFEFYLCPEAELEDEECLLKIPLKLGEGEEDQFHPTVFKEAGVYDIPIILPEDVTCDSCTLLWEVVTEGCDTEADPSCSSKRATTCVDISIVQQKKQNTRVWDFVKGVFGKALRGAAEKVAGCDKRQPGSLGGLNGFGGPGIPPFPRR